MLEKKKIEVFEMRCCRRISKITWTKKIKNEKVLQRIIGVKKKI